MFINKLKALAMKRSREMGNCFKISVFCGAMALGLALANTPLFGQEFHPGEIWQDADGKPINAHGGGMLFHDGTYYWYGEFKTGKTYLPDCNKSWGGTRVDTVGVSCYSSTNLLDWKNEGIVLAATPSIPDLDPSKVLERPKVIYNQG